ncbi:MAG: diaminopimelate epimerase [Candidatus Pacebacteria bacterium]|nr:diaminopimelate epimerase [Candidatus Paceibacterota bacterium]
MRFAKMHGAGNDFVLINTFTENVSENYNELAVKLCDRNFGIGADGLILVLPSEKNDIKMRIFNPDGSEPEMCGNGIRCFARFVYEEKIVSKKIIEVETLAGTIIPEIIIEDEKVTGVKVDMGIPEYNLSEKVQFAGMDFEITTVNMGNPHCVIFVEDLNKIDVSKWGAIIENDPMFPHKTNVEFVQVINDSKMKMKVWERGAGITLACGTGACATLVAGVINNKTSMKAEVILSGGTLLIEWPDKKKIYMTGPAELVFKGEII